MANDRAYTMITAHAGAENTPPNTLESLEALAGCGADAVELDVRAGDGGLVLSHNPLEMGVEYATLSDALDLIRRLNDRMLVNIDLKEMDLTRRVWAEAEACGMAGRLLFTGSVCPVDERFVKDVPAEIWYNQELLLPEEREAPLASVLRRGHRAINIHWPRVDLASLTPETARHYSCWTLYDEAVISAFLRAGVLNITTRVPRRAIALRDQIIPKDTDTNLAGRHHTP